MSKVWSRATGDSYGRYLSWTSKNVYAAKANQSCSKEFRRQISINTNNFEITLLHILT